MAITAQQLIDASNAKYITVDEFMNDVIKEMI